MATAMKRVVATATARATTVVGNKEGNVNSGKSDGNDDKGGWGATAMMVIAMRVVDKQQ